MIDIPKSMDIKIKYGKLENGMKYVLVSDSNSDMGNISMCVNVGSLCDPPEYMGMAHFLEHMLFLGSMKYKEENYFDKKINSYGGTNNAFTSMNNTTYYLSVLNEHLDEILDIFSRFFIDPLFDENSVGREINAIQSEHMKNINNDYWVKRQIIYSLSDSNVNRFTTGSLESFGINDIKDNIKIKKLRSAMIEFYKKYYCPDNLCICIQSNKDLDMMEKTIYETFSEVKKHDLCKPNLYDFPKYKTFNEYVYKPENEFECINYFWDIHDFNYYLYNKAIDVVQFYININSMNNLQNILIKTGYVTSCNTTYFDEGIFMLSVFINKNEDIIISKINNIVYNYLNYLKTVDWDYIYQYMKKNYELNYNYKLKENNSGMVVDLSSNGHIFKEENIYNGPKLVLDIKREYVDDIINIISSDKVNILYGFKKFNNIKETKTEKFYKKEYHVMSKSLKDNTKNEYNFNVTLDISLLDIKPTIFPDLDKNMIPKRLTERFWYGGVSKFKEPFVVGHIYINMDEFFITPKNYILTQIAISVIDYYINIYFYEYFIFGYSFDISMNSIENVITYSVGGYNYNFINIMNMLLKKLNEIKPDINIVKTLIKNIVLGLKSVKYLPPGSYCGYEINKRIYKSYYDNDVLLDLLYEIKFDEIISQINKLTSFKDVPIVTVIYGNILPAKLYTCFTYNMNLEIPINEIPDTNMLESFTVTHPNKNEKNKYTVLSMYCGEYSILFDSMINLLDMIIQPLAFNYLRTKKQLGYIAGSTIFYDNKKYYIHVFVQSSKKNNDVEKIMNHFINKKLIEELNKLSEDEFIILKKSLEDNIMVKYNNMAEMTRMFLPEIRRRKYIFNRRELVVDELKNIKLNDIKTLYYSILKNKKTIHIL